MLQKIRNHIKNLSKGKKRILAGILVFSVVIFGAAGFYAGRHYYTKTFGIKIKPSKDFPITEITYFLQNDPAWGDDIIGKSNSRMSNTGCLISCVASSLNELDVQITPGELNAKLTEIGGYEYDILLWYKLNEVFTTIDYKYNRFFSSDTIDQLLEDKLLPIVNVKYLNGNATHWVMIVGAENGEYMVFDPLNAEMDPIPLSIHGKVYAYRVLRTV